MNPGLGRHQPLFVVCEPPMRTLFCENRCKNESIRSIWQGWREERANRKILYVDPPLRSDHFVQKKFSGVNTRSP